MPDATNRKPRTSSSARRPDRTDAGTDTAHDPSPPAVLAGRRGGIKSAINRPMPGDAVARRKAALHALRFAFEADSHVDDAASPDASATTPAVSAGTRTDA